jgi:hypothetical protein
MRGRPVRELLRQSAPLIAVAAALVAPPVAAGGSPQPDRPPAVPTTLAPDPVPGTAPAAKASPHATAPAAVTLVQPTAPVQPAKPVKTVKTVTHVKMKHTVVEPRPHRAAPAHFSLPRVALPALIAADPVHSPRDLDAVLAGVALLLAAVTAASGARLVAVWNRRAGTA